MYFDTKMAAELGEPELGELPGLDVELPDVELDDEHGEELHRHRCYGRARAMQTLMMDEDVHSARSERSRTPQREAEQDWILMV